MSGITDNLLVQKPDTGSFPDFFNEGGDSDGWNDFQNLDEIVDQNDYESIFDFLKIIRYKQKKQTRCDALKSKDKESNKKL
jgi:hypothetical protein